MSTVQAAMAQDEDYAFRFHYETFRALLDKNVGCLQLLSDLEADFSHLKLSDARIRRPLFRLFDETLLMAQELNLLARNRHADIYDSLARIRRETLAVLDRAPAAEEEGLAVTLDQEEALSPGLVGGKALGVATLSRHFPGKVPPGFVVTTAAYRLFLTENGLEDRIRLLLQDVDWDKLDSRVEKIQSWILKARVPKAIEEAIARNVDAFRKEFPGPWAVRSSAVNEDGRYSFAGQFHSELLVDEKDLAAAYLKVLSGRFAKRAVLYRLHVGLTEVQTPMAVLFMPMVDPLAAGVIHTIDPKEPDSQKMVMNAVPGLGDKVVQGKVQADTFYVTREKQPKLVRTVLAGGSQPASEPGYLSEETLSRLGSMALEAARSFGHDLDIEWALDRDNKIRLLQARRIRPVQGEEVKIRGGKKAWPLAEGGVTIFPGRAEGTVVFWQPGQNPETVPAGAVLVVAEPGPELSAVLPRLAALLCEGGNAAGHAATLVREFSVPCIFRMGPVKNRLALETTVSVNATSRSVYEGSRWVGMRERVLARIASAGEKPRSGPLHDLVVALHLTDPDGKNFRAASCRSIHDSLRFMHEMAVRTLFRFGDEQTRGAGSKSRRLKTRLPLKFYLIDLENSLPRGKGKVAPDEVKSDPFQALWRGFSDSRLPWPDRWKREMMGLPREFRESVLDGFKGPRRARDANYAMIAPDYINVNARFAYHYAMVDAVIGPEAENNHVHFRMRGGGGSLENMQRRTRLVELVLREHGFGVDRRGDLLTGWLRRYPREESLAALEMLGRLIVTTRQLDAVLKWDSGVPLYANHFLEDKFEIFS